MSQRNLAAEKLRAYTRAGKVQHRLLTVTKRSPLMVDLMGQEVEAQNALGGALVMPGDTVLCSIEPIGVRAIIPSRTSGRGTVTAVGGSTATVQMQDGLTHSLAWVGSAPSVGQEVLVSFEEPGALIVGAVSQAAPTLPSYPIDPEPDALPTPGRGRTIVAVANVCCTAQDGRWSSYGLRSSTAEQGRWGASNPKTGYWFYGDKFGGAEGRRAISAQIELRRGPSGYGAPGAYAHLRMHGARNRGATPPALIPGYALSLGPFKFGEVKKFALPVAWAQYLIDNGGGVAISDSSSSDYMQMYGVAGALRWAASGKITIEVEEAD